MVQSRIVLTVLLPTSQSTPYAPISIAFGKWGTYRILKFDKNLKFLLS
nr:MAG TPA: hypothetical protein [Bacteriophage sp.]